MKVLLVFAVAVTLTAASVAQGSDEDRKATRERVKAEQKLLDQQSRAERKQSADAAKYAPTWAVIDAPAADLKGVLIQHMRGAGYAIDTESEHQISFVKEASGKDAMVATIFMGNSYSENPRKHIQFTFTPDEPGKTRIDCSGSVTVRMALGKENRRDTTNYPAFKQDLTAEYTALKSWAAHQKEVAAK